MDERIIVPRASLWVPCNIRELIAKIHLIPDAMLVKSGLPDFTAELASNLE